MADPIIAKFDIEVADQKGFRTSFLGDQKFQKIRNGNFSHCILFCGNNDVSVHPRPKYPTMTPQETAQVLIDFHDKVNDHFIRCAAIGLIQRQDVSKEIVRETNQLLQQRLMIIEDGLTVWSHYVGPRELHPCHFDQNDPAHFTPLGEINAVALMGRVIIEHFKLKQTLKEPCLVYELVRNCLEKNS